MAGPAAPPVLSRDRGDRIGDAVPSGEPEHPRRPGRRRPRWADAGIWLLLLVGSVLQQPGRTTFDTKFDLTADPAGLLERGLSLWVPVTFGELPNQAYGYLFPQGPFFLGADALGVPDWLAQRLWSALLLVAAYEGTRRVARASGLPAGAARLAGLCYALAPRLLGAVGVLSGEVLPQAVLPWAVLPLVLALTGRLSARAGGLLSGVAVLCMSGVNATGTLAALPLAFLVAASGVRRGKAALMGWWLLGAVLACAWWLGPLLVLGRYSPPFLDFIETAAATTNPAGWANGLRGAEHWVAYHSVGGRAWWPGAHALVTSPFVAVVTMTITAVGLAGLLHRRMPLRGPLALSLVVGLVCLTVGNPSAVGSLVDEPVRALLDGPLAALRNVHKVDPLVRLPVALGVATAAWLSAGWLRGVLARRGRGNPVAVRRVVTGALAVLLLAGAPPLVSGDLRTPGWSDVPDAWTQTADFLADRPQSRALVVPGTGFGVQTWGWTIDEPIQGVGDTAWVSRSQVPLVPGPTARVLDAVERRLADGRGSAGLAGFLGRAGVTHVVLRRDLDPAVAETATTDRVERALSDSPGIARVADFGSTGFGPALIEVFEVDDPSGPAALLEHGDVVTLDGGPEDLLTALDAGVVAPSDPVVVTSGREPADLVTDGYRRVERQYGRIHDAVAEVMTGTATYREDRPSPDFPGAPAVARAEAEYLDVAGVSASTAQGYADVFGPVLPGQGPSAAFDGRPETAWRSAIFASPVGQWLQVDLDQPADGGVLEVTFVEGAGTATVREVVVAFDGEGRRYAVPAGGRLLVPMPTHEVRDVRITVVSVVPGLGEGAPVAIAEVEVPGAASGRTLDVPRPIGAGTTVLLADDAPRRACVDVGYGPRCDAGQVRTGEWNGLDRRLTTVEAGTWELSGTVVAEPGPAAAALLGPLGDAAVATSATSLGGDPAVSAAYAFDGRPETPWLADLGDVAATLDLAWSGERTVSRLVVDPAGVPATEPVRARIESSDGVRDVDLRSFGYFEPLRAEDGLSVTFYAPAGPDAGVPLGVGEVRMAGLEGLQHSPAPGSATGAVCGLGPEIRIGGTVHRTEVTGTVGDVVAGRPLEWRVCDGPVELFAGVHRLVAEPTAQFRPLTLTWLPEPDRPTADGGADGRLEIRSWDDERRVVAVAAGPEAVLRIPENTNPGWHATLDGERLEPVVLDGWQQGYVVPAGRSGDVVVEFAAQTWFRGALLAGLGLAVLLIVLALAALRRPRGNGSTAGLRSPDRVLRPAAAVGLGAVVLVVAGAPLVLGWAVGLLRPVRRFGIAVGMLALLAGGVLVATSAGLPMGVPGVPADAVAAAGLGVLLAQVVRVRGARGAA